MMLLGATEQGRLFMVKYLLDSRCVNVNETDNRGQTALIKACFLDDNVASTRKKLIKILLRKGARVNNVDMSGRNLLMWACSLGKVDVVEILFSRSLMDIDFNCADRDGNTALHYTASTGHAHLTTMIAEAMGKFGVSVDKRNKLGVTPFLVAIKQGQENCAQVLLNNGASPHIVDPETLMNAKELAERDNLNTLSQLITITKPRTISRCATLPGNHDSSDDDTMTSNKLVPRSRTSSANCSASCVRDQPNGVCLSGSEAHVNLSSLGVPNIPVRNAFSACLPKRKERQSLLEDNRNRGSSFSELSPKEQHGEFMEIPQNEKQGPCLKKNNENGSPELQSMHFLEIPNSSRSSERRGTTPVIRNPLVPTRVFSAQSKNPYDLRDFQSVLSLYGEQNSSTFRIGFSNPPMTPERFQECLQRMAPPPKSPVPAIISRSKRGSLASVASDCSGPFPRFRRSSSREEERRDGDHFVRSRANSMIPGSIASLCLKKKPPTIVRNNSDPTMSVRSSGSVGKNSVRRQSLRLSTQLQYSANIQNR